MLTIIVAQTEEDEAMKVLQGAGQHPDATPLPDEIPMADDDIETEETVQQPRPQEVPQGQPGVEPVPGLEQEALEPAGEVRGQVGGQGEAVILSAGLEQLDHSAY